MMDYLMRPACTRCQGRCGGLRGKRLYFILIKKHVKELRMVTEMDRQIRLPEAFQQKMQKLLGEEYELFCKSYEEERVYGLRYNPLKWTEEEFLQKVPFTLQKIPWAEEGYYYDDVQRPGQNPLHEAGGYYIQEPSAMAVADILKVSPGDRVLDLCAAPGGKSTQLAGHMRGQGLLVSNEIHPVRAKILSQNIERMGIRNCVVTNETPEHLAAFFPEYFTHILVDAPCSGEGMFRKEEAALTEWSLENVERCAQRQRDILYQAALMLQRGGTLVYSTCTFAPEENEQSIAEFLKTHPDFYIETIESKKGFSQGRPEWAGEEREASLAGTVRLWPHVTAAQGVPGEGHFVARLRREGSPDDGAVPDQGGSATKNRKTPGMTGALSKGQLADWEQFAAENLKMRPQGIPCLFGSTLYLIPEGMIDMRGMKVLRPGLCLGENKKGRFEPSHALALALHPEEAVLCHDLSDQEAKEYLKGTAFPSSLDKGWVLMTYKGCSLGFAKSAGGMLKNHYPKGLRR